MKAASTEEAKKRKGEEEEMLVRLVTLPLQSDNNCSTICTLDSLLLLLLLRLSASSPHPSIAVSSGCFPLTSFPVFSSSQSHQGCVHVHILNVRR